MGQLPIISLFSGAGGMDLGVESAGGDIRVLVEPDRDCVATLLRNKRFFPSSRIVPCPLERLATDEIMATAGLRQGQASLLIGGPPCQPFSKSKYWLTTRGHGNKDLRASLMQEFLRVLKGIRPEGFILENVASLIHPVHRGVFEGFLKGTASAGYAATWGLLHAVEYGVPQSRSRVFVIGLRGKHPPGFPPRSHWWQSGDAPSRSGLRSPETSGRWISLLDRDDLAEPEERIQGKWERHLREIPPGWNYKFHTAWAGHASPTFLTETKYWTFLLKLSPFRPSWTIQASAGPWTGPIHWTCRRLRVPELAALQTFPFDYGFEGTRRAKVRQIGNAVPCLLAYKLASHLLGQICGSGPKVKGLLRYRLAQGYPFDRALTRHRGVRW